MILVHDRFVAAGPPADSSQRQDLVSIPSSEFGVWISADSQPRNQSRASTLFDPNLDALEFSMLAGIGLIAQRDVLVVQCIERSPDSRSHQAVCEVFESEECR